MLAWQDGNDWNRDNAWRGIETVPDFKPVDIWAKRWLPRGNAAEYSMTARRFLGCLRQDGGWSGLPAGWKPTHWTDPMTAQRLRAVTR